MPRDRINVPLEHVSRDRMCLGLKWYGDLWGDSHGFTMLVLRYGPTPDAYRTMAQFRI
jgi:hypothetical protein